MRLTTFATRGWGYGLAAALLLLTWGIRAGFIRLTGFDGLYGQDAFAYFDYASTLRAALAGGQVPPPFFWPIGYPALIAGLDTFLPAIPAAQIVSLAATGVIVLSTFFATREIDSSQPYELAAAVTAALVVALGGQMIISSLASMSDAASLAWATLSLYALLRFHRTRARRWLALAGFSLGWAIMTRWTFALLVPVWCTALVLEDGQAERTRIAIAHRTASGFLHVLWVLGACALALAPQMALIALDTRHSPAGYVGDLQEVTWNFGNAWQSNIANADGIFHYAHPVALYYALPLIHPDYIPIWFTPLVLAGAWMLRRQRFVSILLIGWMAAMWIFLAGIAWENWRFPLAFLPPLAILTGVGLGALLERLHGRPIPFAALYTAAGLIAMFAWGARDASNFIARQMDDRAIVAWSNTLLPRDATVLTFGMTATLAHFAPFQVIEMATETPGSVIQIARADKDVYVLLDVQNVESQWPGKAPQVNFHALRDHLTLNQVGTRDEYVLYSVGSVP